MFIYIVCIYGFFFLYHSIFIIGIAIRLYDTT